MEGSSDFLFVPFRLKEVEYYIPLVPTYSDIDVFLGRRLVELEAERVGQLLSPLEGDDALVLHVALVAHQDDLRVVPGVRLDLGAPKVKKSFLLVVRKSWMILDSMNDLLD